MATLLAVPNFAEGRKRKVVEELTEALSALEGAVLLDQHSDRDHNRSVFTVAGTPAALVEAVLKGAAVARERIDVMASPDPPGVHPLVGALDVAPFVYPTPDRAGVACAAALVAGDRLGTELGLPVLLYGPLAGGRSRSELRRGGPHRLAQRLAEGELKPDFGPPRPHPRAGVTLVGARPPLVAFNCFLAEGVSLARAKAVAAELREGGAAGLYGVRALALFLPSRERLVLSFNVEDPSRTPLLTVLEAVRERVAVAECELVGLAPEAALAGFPLRLFGSFDPERKVLERALARVSPPECAH